MMHFVWRSLCHWRPEWRNAIIQLPLLSGFHIFLDCVRPRGHIEDTVHAPASYCSDCVSYRSFAYNVTLISWEQQRIIKLKQLSTGVRSSRGEAVSPCHQQTRYLIHFMVFSAASWILQYHIMVEKYWAFVSEIRPMSLSCRCEGTMARCCDHRTPAASVGFD